MELKEIRAHWDALAQKHGLDLKSTTKTPTIKQLEINALARAISKFASVSKANSVLEIGCGNGHNLFGLSRLFPTFKFHGVDYSDDMIVAACKIKNELPGSQLDFSTGDVLNLTATASFQNSFDVVFTDRLLINLNSWELQQKGIKEIVSCVKSNGLLVIIENFTQSYVNQNLLRQVIGLPPRTPDPYNKFINEDELQEFIVEKLKLECVYSENFGSLHDLLLYVLLPHINDGKVSYDHPLMESVTTMLESIPENLRGNFGNFGQNNLYVFKKH